MKASNGIKLFLLIFISSLFAINNLSFAIGDTDQIHAVVTNQIFEKVKQNNNWKRAFLTAKNAQVVFMNINPNTNPNNEIGVETHKFDQIIFVAEGNGKAQLGDKITMVHAGDMLFIPQGIKHNVINLNSKKSLKILSIYSDTDIPANTTYQKKSDAPED